MTRNRGPHLVENTCVCICACAPEANVALAMLVVWFHQRGSEELWLPAFVLCVLCNRYIYRLLLLMVVLSDLAIALMIKRKCHTQEHQSYALKTLPNIVNILLLINIRGVIFSSCNTAKKTISLQ